MKKYQLTTDGAKKNPSLEGEDSGNLEFKDIELLPNFTLIVDF